MRYDFETVPERRGMDSIAWDWIGTPEGPAGPKDGFDAIPMWVADMNFVCCPAIQAAIIRRAQHPAFGYYGIPNTYYDAIIRWQTKRNGVAGLEQKHIGYENGVLGGVISALNVMCSRGDKVLLQIPCYVGFTHVLHNSGYEIIHNPMIRDENGIWRLDYDDLERKIVEHGIKATIFCNPHNPCGRVWETEEIRKAMEIFEKHSVWVVSDEIWSDLLLDGHRHTPTQSVSDYAREHTAAFYAPSKTFNLAGLVGSYHIIYGNWLRERHEKEASLSEYNTMNVLSMHALLGAYSPDGEAWVDELNETLSGNVRYACEQIRQWKGISVQQPQGTYMLFLQCEEWCREHGKTLDDLLKMGTDVGVAWQDGRFFEAPWGIRMNLALPLHKVKEAFERLNKYVFC
ncbi:MAG: aminotransferase class I/II-fold pyridoxal phosphate-dependent enzyme [Clostridiales bacterium]|nr:aminotransferase class I/II-fold pyridoxal phosphate-dependent enzyme [Clostridiales bacterium]